MIVTASCCVMCVVVVVDGDGDVVVNVAVVVVNHLGLFFSLFLGCTFLVVLYVFCLFFF